MSLQLLLGYSATPVIRSSDEFAVVTRLQCDSSDQEF